MLLLSQQQKQKEGMGIAKKTIFAKYFRMPFTHYLFISNPSQSYPNILVSISVNGLKKG